VSLFAFSDAVDDGGDDGDNDNDNRPGKRRFPKRKLKCIVKFDLHSPGGSARGGADDARGRPEACKAGHGFACPRCHFVCSYDLRACPGCSLNCYYEAGVGVVVLKERDNFTDVNPQRGAYPRERGGGFGREGGRRTGEAEAAAAGCRNREGEGKGRQEGQIGGIVVVIGGIVLEENQIGSGFIVSGGAPARGGTSKISYVVN
jgi:hypothetical protein